MFELKDFQQIAIDQLSFTFLELWKTGKYRIPLIFKSPTGSGKTIMMAEFLRCLDDNYQFDEDKAYLWVSFGGDDSYSQSKKKLYQYFNEGTDMNLKDVSNLSDGKLYKNNVFFINWAKIKGTDKESKKLRKPNEHTQGEFGRFDEFIKKTRSERDLVLIIDEAHTETDTSLANEVIDLIDPRIILKVTATPKHLPNVSDVSQKKAGFVEVLEEEVIKSGLIKEKLIIQTSEDIQKLENKGLSEDQIMLEMAFNKRLELKQYYQELGLEINPLVLIQLPSDEKEKEEVVTNKKQSVLSYLYEKGVKSNEIAIWLSNEKNNLHLIEKNDNEINFMIFKVAPATGWDCPRADVLVMFREISSPSFHTQIIGRIKRMPEGYHYEKGELNKAYIYTNYNKSHIKDIKESENGNKLPVYFSKLKAEINTIQLKTVFHHRNDYNTLSPEPTFQSLFKDYLDQYFGTKKDLIIDFSENTRAVNSKIDLTQTQVKNQIIVDTEIESFDNFINEIKNKGKNFDYHFSETDIERLYNLLCFEELANQEVEDAKFAPAKSWGALKKALNVWFSERLGLDRADYYRIIVNELLNPNSHLKKAIHEALLSFRKTYDIEIKEKEEKDIFEIILPEKEASFNDDYELMVVNKNVYNAFYIKKNYKGKDNETRFILFLESQPIEWWHKQEDSGRGVFAVEYYDTQEKKNRLFYPDFTIKKGDKVFLLDTKKDETAKSVNTKDKAQALQKWIKDNQSKYSFEIVGGIVDEKHPNWRLNRQEVYIYENNEEWEGLVF